MVLTANVTYTVWNQRVHCYAITTDIVLDEVPAEKFEVERYLLYLITTALTETIYLLRDCRDCIHIQII